MNSGSRGRYDNLGAFGDHVASAELISANPGPFGMATPSERTYLR